MAEELGKTVGTGGGADHFSGNDGDNQRDPNLLSPVFKVVVVVFF